MEDLPVTVYVGVDWATVEHEACCLDPFCAELAKRSVPNTGEGLDEFCCWLVKLGGGVPSSVRVAIEVPHGPVVETLVERGIAVYAINPQRVFRKLSSHRWGRSEVREAAEQDACLR
jgi:transposase